jgi:transposase-like protein
VETLGSYSNKSRTASELGELLAIVPDGPPSRHRQKHRRRWTSQDDAKITAAYEQGATLNDLATQHVVSRWAISTILARYGVTTRYRLIGPKELAQAVSLYESGMSSASIARDLGVAPNTVRTALQSAGVAMRDTHGRQRN